MEESQLHVNGPFKTKCGSNGTVEYDEEKTSMWMHQRRYILTLLDKYGLSEAKPFTTPADISVKLVKDDGVSKSVDQVIYQSMVGSLIYAAAATRPNIAQAVGAMSKFNSCSTEAHLTAVKRRTTHTDVKFHFVKEAPSNGCTQLIYCPKEQMVVDVLKSLSCDRFEHFQLEMGLNTLPSVKSI